jgi:hypothetical protein
MMDRKQEEDMLKASRRTGWSTWEQLGPVRVALFRNMPLKSSGVSSRREASSSLLPSSEGRAL